MARCRLHSLPWRCRGPREGELSYSGPLLEAPGQLPGHLGGTKCHLISGKPTETHTGEVRAEIGVQS